MAEGINEQFHKRIIKLLKKLPPNHGEWGGREIHMGKSVWLDFGYAIRPEQLLNQEGNSLTIAHVTFMLDETLDDKEIKLIHSGSIVQVFNGWQELDNVND